MAGGYEADRPRHCTGEEEIGSDYASMPSVFTPDRRAMSVPRCIRENVAAVNTHTAGKFGYRVIANW
jgi:hypothetical protein